MTPPGRRARRPRPRAGRETRHQPGAVGVVPGQGPLELRRRLLRRVGLENAALGLHDLAQGPEGDPLSIGQTAPLTPADEAGPLLDVLEELRAEPALAHAGLTDDRHQLA